MSDETVSVRLPDGTAGTVPASQAAQLPEGTTKMTAAEVAAEKKAIALDKKYEVRSGNVGQAAAGRAAALGAGAARGVTMGLSDYLGAEFGGREYLNELKEALPGYSAAGEVAGIGGLALATGGAGGAATVGRGLAARAAGAAVRGAFEMGIYGAGRSIGDQALEGKPIDGEKVVAQGLHDALLGGAIGLAGGVVGAGLSRLAGGKSAAAVEKAIAGEAETIGKAAEKAEAGGLRGAMATKAQEASDEFLANAVGANKGQIKTINRSVDGGWSRVAGDLKAELRTELGTASLPADRKALMDGVESALERRTAERAKMLAKADEAGAALAPSPENVIKAIEERFVAPSMVPHTVQTAEGAVTKLVPKFGKEAEVKAAQELVERLRTGIPEQGPTFKDWASAISDIGKEGKFDKVNAPLAAEVKQHVYGMMSDELGRAMDTAMPNMSGSFAAEYRANQKVLQSLIKSRELLETGIAGNASNNAFGLTSRIAGIAGGAVGGLPGMAISAGVSKLVQDRGAMLASDLLERAAGALGARRIAARTEAQVSRGVAALTGAKPVETFGLGDAPFRAPAVVAKYTARSYPEIRRAVEKANSDPSVVADTVAARVGSTHPKLTGAVTETTVRGVQYLASRLPPSKADPYALQPQFDDKDRVSDAERSSFLRAAEAVANPTMVLEEARKGTLTRDHVEAVKAVYPNLYDEMRVAVMESLVSSRTKTSYARRIQLGILLDLPTDKTLSPDFQKAIQGTYQATGPQDAESPPPTLSRPLNVAGSLQTATQAATDGVE